MKQLLFQDSNASCYTNTTINKFQQADISQDQLPESKYNMTNKSRSLNLFYNNLTKNSQISQIKQSKISNKKSDNKNRCEGKKNNELKSKVLVVKKKKKSRKILRQKFQYNKQITNYLLVGQNIYECDNIEDITTKIMVGPNVFSYSRYYKLLNNSINKVEKYFKGFLQQCHYNEEFAINLKQLNIDEKRKLYYLIKNEEKQSQQETEKQVIDLIKNALEQIEMKSIQIIRKFPQKQQDILLWKNKKMHQLMQAQDLLVKQTFPIYNIHNGNIIEHLQQQFQNIVSNSTHLYPINQNNSKPKSQNLKYLAVQKFPEKALVTYLQQQNIQKATQRKYNSYFGCNGFLWYVNNIRQFIKNNQQINKQIIQRIKFPYGLSKIQKINLMKRCQSQWWQQLQIHQLSMLLPLNDQLYITFEHQAVGVDQTQQHIYIHIFNRAILDALNYQLTKFMSCFPNGDTINYLQIPKIVQYSISDFNFDGVWDKCVKNIYESIIMSAGMILNGNLNSLMILEIRQQKLKEFLFKIVEQDYLSYEWLMHIGIGRILYLIQTMIEQQLLIEYLYQLLLFHQ